MWEVHDDGEVDGTWGRLWSCRVRECGSVAGIGRCDAHDRSDQWFLLRLCVFGHARAGSAAGCTVRRGDAGDQRDRAQRGVAFSFFGAALFLILAVVVHVPRLRSRRFVLISLACPLYVAGGFVLTLGVNVPMNEALARVGSNASPEVLARAREAYEDPWNFWNGMRTVCSSLALLALIGACLSRR